MKAGGNEQLRTSSIAADILNTDRSPTHIDHSLSLFPVPGFSNAPETFDSNSHLSKSGQTLNINSSETIVNTMQNINRINDVPTFVPVGSLNASPPISGM